MNPTVLDVYLPPSECLLNPNRNPHLTKEQTEALLKKELGVEKILWLHHGYLAGDDTDSHIDTLARFIDTDTIMYVKCEDKDDEHYSELKKMEEELRALRDLDGEPFELIALPMTNPIFYDDERLPATYANFLIINDAVLLPIYNDPHDEEAIKICEKAFRGREYHPHRLLCPYPSTRITPLCHDAISARSVYYAIPS